LISPLNLNKKKTEEGRGKKRDHCRRLKRVEKSKRPQSRKMEKDPPHGFGGK